MDNTRIKRCFIDKIFKNDLDILEKYPHNKKTFKCLFKRCYHVTAHVGHIFHYEVIKGRFN